MGFRGQDSRAHEARANMITCEFRVGLYASQGSPWNIPFSGRKFGTI